MEAPKLPSFLKIPSYKKFNYKPLYYSERKEALEERVEKIKRELEAEKNEDPKERVKRKIAEKWQRQSHNKQVTLSNIRIFVIFSVLVGLMYYLLKS